MLAKLTLSCFFIIFILYLWSRTVCCIFSNLKLHNLKSSCSKLGNSGGLKLVEEYSHLYLKGFVKSLLFNKTWIMLLQCYAMTYEVFLYSLVFGKKNWLFSLTKAKDWYKVYSRYRYIGVGRTLILIYITRGLF